MSRVDGNDFRAGKRWVAVTVGLLVLIMAIVLGPTLAQADEDWQTMPIPAEVENGVICVLDGCMMNLAACETPAAQQLRHIIREKLFKEGMSKEQTYAYLVSVYGDKVLAAPPRRGFNWVVWLGPFVATIGGGALIYLGLDKWVSAQHREEEETEIPHLSADQMRRLDEELKKYL